MFVHTISFCIVNQVRSSNSDVFELPYFSVCFDTHAQYLTKIQYMHTVWLQQVLSTGHQGTKTVVKLFLQVGFKTDSYGTYKQRVVFSFDRTVYLYRELKVVVQPEKIVNKAADIAITESRRWESLHNIQIIRWQTQ